MRRSANEIAGQVMKAARGAGLPLDVAEDLSLASAALDARALLSLARDMADPARHGALVAACVEADGACPHSAVARAVVEVIGGRNLGARDVPAETWSVLDALAVRTYVPASDQSRAAGAGAGLSDND